MISNLENLFNVRLLVYFENFDGYVLSSNDSLPDLSKLAGRDGILPDFLEAFQN